MIRKLKKPKLIVNPEKKAVAAILEPTADDYYKEFQNTKQDIAGVVRMAMRSANAKKAPFAYGSKFKFVGVAKCSGDDVYNEEFGKNLADMKAKLKYHDHLRHQYNNAAYLCLQAWEYLIELAEEHFNAAEEVWESVRDAQNS